MVLLKTLVKLFTIILFHITSTTAYNLTVLTNNGYVEGYKVKSAANSNNYFYSFRGVPYGEPPVGSLRFQDPRPVSSWDGVKQTKAYKDSCAAHKSGTSGSPVIGSEDCLYLNIHVSYTEKDNANLSLPVVVWTHGGAFVRGTPFANPSYLLEEKPIIAVVVAYRLGVLGFLSTEDENAWGNVGLKDQSLGLRWVKENIKNFGGDPNQITIWGQSAGSASVQYQVVSPWSAGLFNQAIMQSGSTLNEWGFSKKPKELTVNFAKLFNITSTDTKEVVKGLQKIDFETLVDYSLKVDRFLPSVEVDHVGAFVNQSTYEKWNNGDFNKVPVMLGYTSEDGAYAKGRVAQYTINPKLVIPAGLNIDEDSSKAEEVVEKITNLYFPGKSYGNNTNSFNFMTQHYFARGIRKTVGDLVKTSQPVYFYRFSYVTTENYTKGANGGAGHGEDNLYLFPNNLTTERDVLTRKRMVKMWTNFITYGNPTPEEDSVLGNVIWPEVRQNVAGDDDVRYLEIGNELVTGINPFQQDYLFWRELFQNYSNPTVYTY